ncbi:MAG: haloacid dehalogenase type II [Burkholderiaceae bacterium]
MHPASDVQLLLFDVFGTVVDWRASVAREVEALGLGLDGAAFADAWRRRYLPSMQAVREGQRPWVNLDGLHRENLEAVLERFGVANRLDEAALEDLNLAWHRLEAWPDAAAGLQRLRARFVVSTLSNGNTALLVNLSKHAGLSWDAVLCAETFQAYKPDPKAYRSAVELFGLQPHQAMLCAAHAADLRAAAACGLRTAYVDRPLEWGPDRRGDIPASSDRFDMESRDLRDLAAQLGC